MIKIAKEPL